MLSEKISIHPKSESTSPAEYFASSGRNHLPPNAADGKKDGPLQRLLTESGLEELERLLKQPAQLGLVDLGGIATRGVSTLSAMSSELGVLLRLRIREDSVPIPADFESIRRLINALIIHLLTLSQSQACVTVTVESREQEGKRGMSVRLYSDHVVGSWKSAVGVEEADIHSQEVSTCRLLLKKIGGTLSVQSGADEELSFLVWLPLKGSKGKLFH
jgi:signal transduction histidine kinase